jgi:hypothetical protein
MKNENENNEKRESNNEKWHAHLRIAHRRASGESVENGISAKMKITKNGENLGAHQ